MGCTTRLLDSPRCIEVRYFATVTGDDVATGLREGFALAVEHDLWHILTDTSELTSDPSVFALYDVATQLSDAVVGLIKVECGLSNTTLSGYCDPARPGLLQGLGALDAGVSQLVSGVVAQVQGGIGGVSDTPANLTLRGGIDGRQDGVAQPQPDPQRERYANRGRHPCVCGGCGV